ncbi:hypothetical protein BH24ACT24_BH24ACT24_00530 [soil metagenome]
MPLELLDSRGQRRHLTRLWFGRLVVVGGAANELFESMTGVRFVVGLSADRTGVSQVEEGEFGERAKLGLRLAKLDLNTALLCSLRLALFQRLAG